MVVAFHLSPRLLWERPETWVRIIEQQNRKIDQIEIKLERIFLHHETLDDLSWTEDTYVFPCVGDVSTCTGTLQMIKIQWIGVVDMDTEIRM